MAFYISGPKLLFETTEISTHSNSTQQELYIFIHNEVLDLDKNSTQPEIRVNRVQDNESKLYFLTSFQGPSLSLSYMKLDFNYLCNQYLSPLALWVRISLIARCTRYNIICDNDCQWLAACGFLRFPPIIKLTARYKWNIVEDGVKHHTQHPCFWFV